MCGARIALMKLEQVVAIIGYEDLTKKKIDMMLTGKSLAGMAETVINDLLTDLEG